MKNNSQINISGIYQDVKQLLGTDKSGHGMDHVDRVLRLATMFAEDEQGADKEIVALAALLHDVDDYKIVGQEQAGTLLNARTILEKHAVEDRIKNQVLEIIRSMGYNKYLEGIRPTTLEGMIVSDADMCDAIGATGILRTHTYALSKGAIFFDKSVQPERGDVEISVYKTNHDRHSVQHFFDKLLRVPSILMTDAGRKEGEKRNIVMRNFLHALFEEEDSQVWRQHLEAFKNDAVS